MLGYTSGVSMRQPRRTCPGPIRPCMAGARDERPDAQGRNTTEGSATMSKGMEERAAGSGRLRGKVALITGAGSGIGQAVAGLFAREGARVVCADRSDAVEEVAAAIRAQGGEAIGIRCDVSQEVQVEAAVVA